MHVYGIKKNGTDEPICRTEIEMQRQTAVSWTQGGAERLGQTQYCHVHTAMCKLAG